MLNVYASTGRREVRVLEIGIVCTSLRVVHGLMVLTGVYHFSTSVVSAVTITKNYTTVSIIVAVEIRDAAKPICNTAIK